MFDGERRRQRAVLAAIAAATAALLAAAGCSSAGVDAAARPACDTPGVTDTEIKLGLLLSDSGLTVDVFRGTRGGVDARLGLVNETGGVHGRQLVYDWRDDQSDAGLNLARARELVQGEDVFAVFEASGVVQASAQYLHDSAIPVAGVAQDAVWSEFPNMISYENLTPRNIQLNTIGKFAREAGAHKGVIVYASASEASVVGRDRIRRVFEHTGIEFAGAFDWAPGVTDPARLGHDIAATDADFFTTAISPTDFAEVYAVAKESGAHFVAAVSPTGLDQSVVDQYQARIGGASYYTSVVPFQAKTPAHERYLRAMAVYAPGQPADLKSSINAYITTDLLIRGLEAAGDCPTREGLLTALRGIDAYDADGMLSAPVDLTKGFGQPARCFTFMQVAADGHGFEVHPESPVCADEIPPDAPADAPAALAGTPR